MNTTKVFAGAGFTALIAGAALVLSPAVADQVIPDDLIVQASTCTGFDCVNNEVFGFDTLKLKENNLRIFFQDTSTASGFPSNSWRLIANDTFSLGAAYFAIEDSTANRQVFRVAAGAHANSIYVDASARVGLGTATPALKLHLNEIDTPAVRLEQNVGGGFTPQTWDIAGNDANFFVRDVTGGSRLPFRIRPLAPTSSIDVAANGNVGLGTATPNERLTANGAVVATAARSASAAAQAAATVAIVDVSANNARFAAGSNGGNSRGISLSSLNGGTATTAVEISPRGDSGFGTVPYTGQRVDVNGGLTVSGYLFASMLSTFPSNMCRSALGQVIPGFYALGDCASDARLKHDIVPLADGALGRVLALKPATFRWNGDPAAAQHAGFIAQETLPHVPEAVGVSPTDGYYTWDSNAVLAYAVKAVQELDRKVDAMTIGTARAAAGSPAAVRLAGADRAGDVAPLETVVAELMAVIRQQQQRIEALERKVAP
jgi:hypothetical protein